jgi:murein DD-endopeptidase MepM/ murein hydrolase activator NlpD
MRRAVRTLIALAAVVALAAAGSGSTSHTVQAGDTLSEIAAEFGVSTRALMAANDLDDPDHIRAGQVLTIPAGDGGGEEDVAYHVVAPGEGLGSIAARYGVSLSDLIEWNGRPDGSVWAGSRLRIGGASTTGIAGDGDGPGGAHEIRPGDTLSEIAAHYGVSSSTLADLNDLANPDLILAGTSLVLPGAAWHCPVDGGHSFVNDFGMAKGGDRFHDGVDLFADRGTPVVAPVTGEVEQVRGDNAGLQVTLRGDDGHTYIGTHLDDFGADGRVAAGEVIGYVGSTGNAAGTAPHLHFEIYRDGQDLINPYPTLRDACG